MTVMSLLGGCDGWKLFANTNREWREEVILPDGATIVVERKVTYEESNSLSGDAYGLQVKSSTLAFSGKLAALPVWSALLDPMVLYRDATQAGQWVIVAKTSECDVWSQRGEPQPPYFEFRLVDKNWQEAPLSPTSIDQPANLLLNYQRLEDSKVTASMSQSMDRENSERYRLIRAQAKSNCGHSSRNPYGYGKVTKE
jgi:hypothetical protein